ncbi:MAG: tRNA pseudouridine(38-40) synthase TruA [Chloroflexi bacterium]|nr:tRNA pseudouridine(38-40) synthase TruA [Chloroflexota bacterium]
MDLHRKIALVVEYDGTAYAGFQLQRNAPSIQGELEKAVTLLTQQQSRVQGAGRTDAGVHAKGQVVAFGTHSGIPCESVVTGLNHFLPKDIAVQQAYDMPVRFDPRRHARSRRYRYMLLCRGMPGPLDERYAFRVSEPLDERAMSAALGMVRGTHDFAALASSPGPGKATIREVYDASLSREGEHIHIEVEANAFLPHQMRRMAGMIVSVGAGRLTLEGVGALLEGNTESEFMKFAPTLPPQGLCLIKVTYKDFPPDEYQTKQDLQR